MKAHVALFHQPGVEANYPGYERVDIDYVDQYFLKPVGVKFPAITKGNVDGINHIAIISENGAFLCTSRLDFPLSAKEGEAQAVILFCVLPEDLNPIAKTAYQLVAMGEMKAEDLHPKLYESINDELHKWGIPVIPCVRAGAATMKAEIINMPSLRDVCIQGIA